MAKSPMSGRTVLLVALGVLLLTVATVAGLWWWAGGLARPELATARLDALRIGLSVGLGGGGAFALYLAWRRQRSTEETLAHERQVAAATEADALERRITDLYTKAVEQLGSDKAPVRLGGLYALERLAQNNPDQRQTIVNVLCAYLRMPVQLPEDDRQPERMEEREVRLAAQRILAAHLRPGDGFWSGINLDLNGATLIDFDLADCRVNEAGFRRAALHGDGTFEGTVFTGRAQFDDAYFAATTSFDGAVFELGARFERAKFTLGAWFQRTTFAGTARFGGAEFRRGAWFDDAVFANIASFDEVSFAHRTTFERARFAGLARFGDARFETGGFTKTTEPEWQRYLDRTSFDGATFAEGMPPEVVPFVDRAAGGS